MNFDQMLDAWRAQDDKPLYGLNKDLLRLVLQHEQADIRRALRWELWIACICGTGMAVFAGFWLWVLIFYREPMLHTVAAGASVGVFGLWIGAFWLSRRRQGQRERSFGNTLQEEVRRNLSLVEYQLSNGGRLGSALQWSILPMVGAVLIYWLMSEINDNTDFWFDASMIIFLLGSGVWGTFVASREAERKLEPRRKRLSELLEALNTRD